LGGGAYGADEYGDGDEDEDDAGLRAALRHVAQMMRHE
jgi:hypothetical protein